jgi:hypothetical protein
LFDDDGRANHSIGCRNVKQQSFAFFGHRDDWSDVGLLRPHKLLGRLEEFKERQALVVETGYETAQGGHVAGEFLDIFDALGRLHPQDGLNLLGIRSYAITTDYIAEQYTRRDTEYTLLRVQLPLEGIEGLKGLVEVSEQAGCHLCLYHHIVDVCLDELISDLVLEAHLDGSLVGHPGILKPERHSRVAVGVEGRDEGRFDLVFLLQGDLVIARITIKERQELATGCGVHDLVYTR